MMLASVPVWLWLKQSMAQLGMNLGYPACSLVMIPTVTPALIFIIALQCRGVKVALNRFNYNF